MSGLHLDSHSYLHAHEIEAARNYKRLGIALVLSLVYMVAEAVGGFVTNSLALLADAGHMLSDVAALALSLLAIRISRRAPTSERTYGFYRAEILAALVNGTTLIAISLFIFIEAYYRFLNPPKVQGGLMVAIAVGGLAVNLISLRVLSAGRGKSLNIHGAWLHVFTDALGSVGAILGGIGIWIFGWNWADPLVSVIIGILVIYSSWVLLRESVAVLMEGTPSHLNVDAVRGAMTSVPGVDSVHDLHIWSITSGVVALSGHVCIAPGHSTPSVLAAVRRVLHEQYSIEHLTIQVEPTGFDDHGSHV